MKGVTRAQLRRFLGRGAFNRGRCNVSFPHDHLDTVAGPDRDRGDQSQRLAGNQFQAETPGDGSQEQDRLHHGEAVADANPRAVAKGEVRRGRFFVASSPQRDGLNRSGSFQKRGVALDDPLRHQHLRPFPNRVAADLAVFSPRGRLSRLADRAASIP